MIAAITSAPLFATGLLCFGAALAIVVKLWRSRDGSSRQYDDSENEPLDWWRPNG